MDIFILNCKDYKSRDLSYEFLLFVLQKKYPTISPNILKSPFGKPLVTNIPNCFFSISHSGKFLVVAIHSKQIGVDIQKIKPVNFNVVNRFFSQEEIYNFSLVPNNEKTSHFFYLWTLKESFVKCCGLGVSTMTFNKFSILFDDTIKLRMDNRIHESYNFDTFDNIQNDYKLAICYEGNSVTPNFITIDLDEFFTHKKQE